MSEVLATSRKITLTDVGELLVPIDAEPDAASARRYGLLIFCAGEAQLRLLDDGASVVIGRHEPAEVLVRDGSVSRQHARFIRCKDEVWVEDLDSRHGTFLGGRAIKREKMAPFDEVAIGTVRIVLAATAATAHEYGQDGRHDHDEIVICNASMQRLYADAACAARGRLPVLVLGETGVGKEHVAQAIHRRSSRSDKPFIAVNCAAIAPSLLESTLFGHERGAFTGASQRGLGVFERAHGGMLFLDEIGDLGASAQVALLRAIETQKITRLGSASEIKVDVHVISATHCDLQAMVEEGTFRGDLFFRLNGVCFDVPPLRRRTDEIEPLARFFLAKACREWNLGRRELSPDALAALRRCTWPGNVRQLRYALERAALLTSGALITSADLPDYVASDDARAERMPGFAAFDAELGLRSQLKHYERALLDEALRRAGGDRKAAAKLLRIPLRTLFRRLRAIATPDEDACRS
jgi:two-component system response regulator AtoC